MKEVLKSTNHIYIVMELITGGELFDKIVAAKKFEEDTARRYFRQLIEGISYCHHNNIAHRDLKPENLLLDGNDNLKISDFGLSGIVNSNSLLQTICGTPHYVAPEVFDLCVIDTILTHLPVFFFMNVGVNWKIRRKESGYMVMWYHSIRYVIWVSSI